MENILVSLTVLIICHALNFRLTSDAQAVAFDLSSKVKVKDLPEMMSLPHPPYHKC